MYDRSKQVMSLFIASELFFDLANLDPDSTIKDKKYTPNFRVSVRKPLNVRYNLRLYVSCVQIGNSSLKNVRNANQQ